MAQQMPPLIVQRAVSDKPDLMPVAVSLNLFFQYLGATVTQVLGGIVFRSILNQELAHHAGLNAEQMALLSAAGTAYVRETAEQNFPKLLRVVLEAYNTAITSTFVSGPVLMAELHLTRRKLVVCCGCYHGHSIFPGFRS
jgi:hypothetical protein